MVVWVTLTTLFSSVFVPVHPTYFPPFVIYFCCLLFIFYSCTVCLKHSYFVYSILFMWILSFYSLASFSGYFFLARVSSVCDVCVFFILWSLLSLFVSLLLQTEFKVEKMLHNILIVSFTLTLVLYLVTKGSFSMQTGASDQNTCFLFYFVGYVAFCCNCLVTPDLSLPSPLP